MHRQLQARADDLAEWLLIFELEMRRSRTLERRMEAFRDFQKTVDRIDSLRRDAELAHVDRLLVPLDKKVAGIMRSPAYRISEWFDRYDESMWFVGPATFDAIGQVTQC
jgi:hypothetical protein